MALNAVMCNHLTSLALKGLKLRRSSREQCQTGAILNRNSYQAVTLTRTTDMISTLVSRDKDRL